MLYKKSCIFAVPNIYGDTKETIVETLIPQYHVNRIFKYKNIVIWNNQN